MNEWLKKYRWHVVFWATAYFLSFTWMWAILGFWPALWRSVVNGILVVAIFYLNWGLFIPLLLQKRRYLLYVIFSLIFLLSFAFLRYFLDVVFLPTYPIGAMANLFFRDQFLESYEGRLLVYYWVTSNFHYFIGLVYSLNTDLNRERAQKAELEQQRLEAELKFLKSQMQPHFLLNTLNNIYSLTYFQNPQAPVMLLKLSENLKYLLYECDQPLVPLQDEVQFIAHYVALNQLRLDRPEKIHWEVSGVLPQHRVPPMLFLAFVENAFKHSDTESNEAGFVRLSLRVEGQNVVFASTNTIRPQANTLQEKSGIGLQNVRQRLEILFGNHYQLDTAVSAQEYRITFQFPWSL